MTKKLVALFLVSLMVIGIFAGCSDHTDKTKPSAPSILDSMPSTVDPDSVGGIDYDATVVYNIFNKNENDLNPYLMPSDAFMRHVFCSPLVMFYTTPDGTRGMEYVLAESIECNADNTEFTITLREGLKWHDGEPLTAHDVVYSASVLWYDDDFLYSQYSGREDQPGVWTEVDERTIHVKYESSYDNFLVYLDETLTIAPAHILEGMSGEELNTFDFNGTPIGSGPFKYVEHVTDEYMLLERFDDYYEPALIKYLRLQYITEDSVAILAMQSGELDVTITWDAITHVLDETEGVNVYRIPEPRIQTLFFNCMETSPYSDIYVRKAYACLYNAVEICNNVMGGMGIPYSSLYYTQAECHDPSITFESFSVEQARKYLEEGGYTLDKDGYFCKDGVRLELDFGHTKGAGSDEEKIGLTLQYYAKQAGIYMTVNNYDKETWKTMRNEGTWDIMMEYNPMGPTVADCMNNFVNWLNYTSEEGGRGDLYFGENFAKIKELSTAAYEASISGDKATAMAKAEELAIFITENTAFLPLYGYVTAYNAREGVHIEECCYDELQFLNRMWVEKKK